MSGLMEWPSSRRHKAPGEWVKHTTDKELDVLMGLTDLSKQGPLPSDAALLYQEFLARAEANMATTFASASPDFVATPTEMSFADWVKFKWQSADTSFRHTLRTVAEALRISVPMSRTRISSAGGKDSSPIRRSESALQLTHDEQAPTERPAEKEEPEEPRYDDPPEWHDELADGWEPCSSLHDALHSEDRGWN